MEMGEIPSVLSLMRINEAYLRVISEDAEGKNINRAEKFVKQSHPEIIGQRLENGVDMTPRVFTQEIRNLMPNVRGANCKFLLGAARIYFDDMSDDRDDMQRKASVLNKILKIATSDTHVNEYDHNLNGMSLKELEGRFGGAVSQSLKDDMADISSKRRERNGDYDIVKIPDFETAEKYGRYTSWCVTHDEDMYDNYTSGATGLFYFCLRKGYQAVSKVKGDGCPLDDYGKSMIAVSVNDDGSLNTCTCRWNHENGGNDSIMTTSQISDLLGVDFYKTFMPRDAKEILHAYRSNSVGDDFADKMGWIAVLNGNSMDYVALDKNATPPRVVKMRLVYKGMTSVCDKSVCVATDRFRWYDGYDGKRMDAPDVVYGDMRCTFCKSLVSLDGSPREVKGAFNVSHCTSLKDIRDLPKAAEDIYMSGCRIPDGEMKHVASNETALRSFFDLDDNDVIREKGGLSVSKVIRLWGLVRRLPSAFRSLFGFNNDDTQSFFDLSRHVDPEPFNSTMRSHGIGDIGWDGYLDLANGGNVRAYSSIFAKINNSESIINAFHRIFGTVILGDRGPGMLSNLLGKLFVDREYGIRGTGDDRLVKIVIPPYALTEVVKASYGDSRHELCKGIVQYAQRREPKIFDMPNAESIKDAILRKSRTSDEWKKAFKAFAEELAATVADSIGGRV